MREYTLNSENHGKCRHTRTETRQMPAGHMHFAKTLCVDCGAFVRWEKNPATIEREKRNADRIHQLQSLPLTPWQQEFVASIASCKKLSPRQQAKLDEVFEERSR